MPPSSVPATSANEPNLGIIFAIVVGAIAAFGIATGIVLYIVRARKNKAKSQELSARRFGHKYANSDSSVSPLLYTKVLRTSDDHSRTPDNYPLTSLDNQKQMRNTSTDSIETIKPSQGDRFSISPSGQDEDTPLISDISHSSSRTLTRLTIPPFNPPYVPPSSMADKSPYSYAPSSAGSDSSVSLYSQASALSREPTFKPRLMPLMIPQYTQEDETKSQHPPARSETVLIGKLLKKRAKRNPNKIDRSISRIERAGSIRSVADDDSEDEEQSEIDRKRRQPSHRNDRHREPKFKPDQVATLNTSAVDSGPEILCPPSRSTSTKRDTPTAPVIPSPPATLASTSWVHTPPPQRPHSFIIPPPRSSSRPVSQTTSHTYSWSFGDQVSVPLSKDLAPEKAHVRQHSAERMVLDAVWPVRRNMPLQGVVGAV